MLLSTLPDLTVLSVEGPISAKTGQTISVTATIQNSETGGETGLFQVETQLVGTNGGFWILDRSLISGLAPGQSITVVGSGDISVSLPDQPYYIRAIADVYDHVVESDETNNSRRGNDVQIVRPDLTVTEVSGPGSAKTGETISVTATIQNSETGGETGLFQVETQLVGTSGGFWILDRSLISGLAPGESITVVGSGDISVSLPDQPYYIRAIADVYDHVVESDETNNSLRGNDVQIVRPDLTVTEVSGPSSAKTGETISVTATIQNSETGGETGLFQVETQLVGTSGGFWILDRSLISGLGPGESITVVGSGDIPVSLPDQPYYIRAIADVYDQVVESDETNNSLRGNDVFIGNLPPVITSVTNNGPVGEASRITVTVAANDPNGDPLVYWFDFDGDFDYEVSNSTGEAEHIYGDNGNYTVNVQVTDDKDGVENGSTTVEVTNVKPSVGPVNAPISPIEVGSVVDINLSFSDPGFDTESFLYDVDWGEGTVKVGLLPTNVVNGSPGVPTSGTISDSHNYTTPGVYSITVTVTDDDGGSDQSIFQYVVVFDPNGAFVSGGGWIMSPEGGYRVDPSATGKATLAFLSKYQQGTTDPTGQAEFRFQVADLFFHSESYEWLVVADHKAMFKGDGLVNGGGDYGFLISAVDAALTPSTDVDLFRIKIWDKSDENSVIYDNNVDNDSADDADPATALGGGGMVIQNADNNLNAASAASTAMVGTMLTQEALAPVVGSAFPGIRDAFSFQTLNARRMAPADSLELRVRDQLFESLVADADEEFSLAFPAKQIETSNSRTDAFDLFAQLLSRLASEVKPESAIEKTLQEELLLTGDLL
jgi:hypothetical protein